MRSGEYLSAVEAVFFFFPKLVWIPPLLMVPRGASAECSRWCLNTESGTKLSNAHHSCFRQGRMVKRFFCIAEDFEGEKVEGVAPFVDLVQM